METRTSNPVRMDREDEKKMLPCRFFIGGYCHKANRCRFYHPQPGGLSSMMIVPPLPHHFSTPPVVSPNTPRNNHFLSSTPSSIRSGNLGSTRRGSRSESVIQNLESLDYGYSPPSPTYSEYDVAYQNKKYEPEPEEQAQAPQNTVFNHIDWTLFLAPGCLPPPPIQIGSEEANMQILPPVTSNDVESDAVPFMNSILRQKLAVNIENEDTPPEGRQSLEVNVHEDNLSPTDRVKLSAKLELQMKVQQIAKELADEPAKHVRNLDSFFRTYNFKALPLSNASLMDENMNEIEIIEATSAENEENEIKGKEKDASVLSLPVTNIESDESKENIPTEVN